MRSLSAEVPPPIADPAELPDELRQQRLFRELGDGGMSIAISLGLHLTLLAILNLWWFFQRPQASGYVINCEILTDDLGAQGAVNAVVDVAVPDEPPPGEEDVAPPSTGHGAGEGEHPVVGNARGSGEGTGGGGVGFFGTKGQGNSFVFIVDRSGSMRGDRLSLAKVELSKALGQLQPHQQFYVIFYSANTYRMLGALAPDGLVPATVARREAVRAWVDGLSVDGGTEPSEAMQIALEMQPDVIFFLTDGEIPEGTRDIARQHNYHGTVIHTTGLISKQGEPILQAIAEQSGGTYRHVTGWELSLEELDRLKLPELARSVRQEERAATAKLTTAQRFLRENRPLTARKWLEVVVKDYPHTPQAEIARNALSSK